MSVEILVAGRCEFAAGSGTAYCGPTAMALSRSGEVDAVVEQLVAQDAEIGRLAAAARWTDGAIAVGRGRTVELAIRGDIAASVDGARLRGSDEWQLHRFELERPASVLLRFGEERRSAHASVGGVVPACSVRRTVVPDEVAPGGYDELLAHTVGTSAEDAAVRPPDDPGPPLGVLVFSSGERVVVDKPLMIGRNPQLPPNDPSECRPRLVRVASPGVSRQHAVVSVDRWHATIDDLGSSNGTRVTVPGGPRLTVVPGVPVELVAGTVVDLGDAVSFTVEEFA